jgi:hypothetical protein
MQKTKSEIVGLVFELVAVCVFITVLYLITLFL